MRIQIAARGEFFGTTVAEQRLGGFIASLTDYDRGSSIPWHRHSEPYITFVVAGDYQERLAKSTRDCGARQLVLHEAGELHADHFGARSRCLNIHYEPQRVGMVLKQAGVVVAPIMASIATRAARELCHADSLSPIVIEGLLLQLFGELARERESNRAPRWLQRVREEIAVRFREPLTISALAASVQVHPVHLARSFSRHFGRTTGEIIRELRVEHAKAAIRSGVPLSEVAVDAGFCDQSHLTRTFRRVTGVTPAEFRRANRVPQS